MHQLPNWNEMLIKINRDKFPSFSFDMEEDEQEQSRDFIIFQKYVPNQNK